MGFRTTLTSEHVRIKMPEWFVEKYSSYLHFNEENETESNLPFSTKYELKMYGVAIHLDEDIQKALIEIKWDHELEVILFHECGGVTKMVVSKDYIKYFEPIEWKEVEYITHDYCYECSVPKKIK